ncbi:hypothetical protein E2562_013929 [Oryza meyeriana var. granulata]|uniref:Uncharacterized protein n=1 Tax=Oryza meyeriana var. granulata TaxID=110450 RepID=A0A6G1C7S0_9ORYZ|nr:hypothetical protein E2562_013929 [Oryza meyeriana var. granulata]
MAVTADGLGGLRATRCQPPIGDADTVRRELGGGGEFAGVRRRRAAWVVEGEAQRLHAAASASVDEHTTSN